MKWTVPTGTFNPTNPTGNTMKVTLLNTLMMQDEDTFFTIKQGAMDRIPEKPTYKVTEGTQPFIAGDSVTVEIKTEVTHNAIKGFLVWVRQETDAGQLTQYVVEQDWIPIEGTVLENGKNYSYASYTWTFPDAARYVLQASAVDSENLNSGKSSMDFRTFQPNNMPGGLNGIDWMQIALIAGAILVLIGAIFLFVPSIPSILKTLGWVLLIIGVALLICYAVVSMGLIKAAPAMIGGWFR